MPIPTPTFDHYLMPDGTMRELESGSPPPPGGIAKTQAQYDAFVTANTPVNPAPPKAPFFTTVTTDGSGNATVNLTPAGFTAAPVVVLTTKEAVGAKTNAFVTAVTPTSVTIHTALSNNGNALGGVLVNLIAMGV